MSCPRQCGSQPETIPQVWQHTPDTSPGPYGRGNWRGFLPATLEQELQAGADSGAGLALVGDGAPPSSSALGWAIFLGALFLISQRSR